MAEGLRACRTLVRLCTAWCDPARALFIPVFVMGVVVRARVARVVRVLEGKVVFAIVRTLQRLEVA